jgi:hypothetical protein
MKKIYGFINGESQLISGGLEGVAISEDGYLLARTHSHNKDGIIENLNILPAYDQIYPNGWHFIFQEDANNPELLAAIALSKVKYGSEEGRQELALLGLRKPKVHAIGEIRDAQGNLKIDNPEEWERVKNGKA